MVPVRIVNGSGYQYYGQAEAQQMRANREERRDRQAQANFFANQQNQAWNQAQQAQQQTVPNEHPGRDAAAAAAVTYVATEQTQQYFRYRKFVGPENASLAGFGIWQSQMRPLRRSQPRVNVRRGALFAGVTVVLFALAYIPGCAVIFGILALVSLLYVLSQLRHQSPPAEDLQAIRDWHRAYAIQHGVPPWNPGDILNERVHPVGQR